MRNSTRGNTNWGSLDSFMNFFSTAARFATAAKISLFVFLPMVFCACNKSSFDKNECLKASKVAVMNDLRKNETFHNMTGWTVYVIPSSGQSNSVGGLTIKSLSTVSSFSNLYAFQGGMALTRLSEPVVPTLFTASRPIGETHVTSMGQIFENEAGRDLGNHVLVLSSHGVGGMDLKDIGRGGITGSYDTIMESIFLLKARADKVEAKTVVPYLAFVHGESDSIQGHPRKYSKNLLKYIRNIDRDVKKITSQKANIRLVMTQVSGGPNFYIASNSSWDNLWRTKISQWQTSVKSNDVVLASPTYMIPLEDGALQIHYQEVGYQRIGEYLGKAMSYMTKTGNKWYPLQPVSVSQSTRTVEVAFHVPVSPLQWDASIHAPNGGFELFDTSGKVSITSATISGNDKVLLRVSRELQGIVTVRYGYQAYTGNVVGGGALMDSDSTVSLHGFSLRNYCVLFEMTS